MYFVKILLYYETFSTEVVGLDEICICVAHKPFV